METKFLNAAKEDGAEGGGGRRRKQIWVRSAQKRRGKFSKKDVLGVHCVCAVTGLRRADRRLKCYGRGVKIEMCTNARVVGGKYKGG